MANLDALGQQLASTEAQLGQYSANLPSEIQTQIQNAYTPALQQSLGATKDMMGDFLGRYYDTTTMGPGMAGTTAKDLSPTQKLGVMGRELGTMAGQLQYSQKLSDYLGGQMTDMYDKALTAAQMGQQNLADQYNRQFQQYQLAWQENEAEKDRQLQRSLSGGGGTTVYLGGSDGNTSTTTDTTTNDNTDITIPGGSNLTKTSSGLGGYYLGTDLTNWDKMNTTQKLLGLSSVWNPLTLAKTGGSILGNIIGNKSVKPVTKSSW